MPRPNRKGGVSKLQSKGAARTQEIFLKECPRIPQAHVVDIHAARNADGTLNIQKCCFRYLSPIPVVGLIKNAAAHYVERDENGEVKEYLKEF